MRRFLLILVLLFPTLPALAWNGAGHRLTAAIAWQQLSPAARTAVNRLLAGHPAYAEWIAHAESEDAAHGAFLEASTWADDIRHDPRYFDEAQDAPTPPLPDLPDTARHRRWHYVDVDAQGVASGDGELDRRLAQLLRQLRDPGATRSERIYALPWLIHLIGDIHQPLHVGSRRDEGGNRFPIADPFNPRLPESNLHRWWDDLPGPPWLRGKRLERAAAGLLARHPQTPPQGDPALWKQESWYLAHRQAYPSGPAITSDFRAAAETIAERRIVEAGWRLGRLLQSLFGDVPRETASE